MKNPLIKRLPREIIGDFGKYLVIFLFMTLTIGFISGFLVAGGSMMQAYEDSFEKYNIEDGHFVLKDQLSISVKKELENNKVTLYSDFYKEEQTDHDLDGTSDSTIRIYKDREQVNTVCLMEGKLPVGKEEIAIDRMYAQNNDIQTGDQIQAGGRELTVTGLVALPDYSALFSDNNDIMFDAVKFSVAVMTEEGYEEFPEADEKFCYCWMYETKPADDVAEKELSEDFLEVLAKETSRAGIDMDCFVPRYANQAIQFTGSDMGGDRTMMIVLLYILIVILAFVFSVMIKHTIAKEAAVIGTLRASGYTRGELLRHYLAMPMIVTLLAAVVGNILGYTFFKDVAAAMYYGSYSLTTYVTIWNGEAFILTTVVPLLIMLATNMISLMGKLRLSPLKFLRRDLKRRNPKKTMRLPEFRFFTRFRLRIIFQNRSSYVTLFVGILFSSVLLVFGMMMPPLFSHYKEDIDSNMLAAYQYVLSVPLETEDETAEKYCMTSLNYQGSSRDEDISIYGIEENSRYVKAEMPDEGVCISDSFAEKYHLEVGDDITLKEKYGSQEYSFHICKVIKYPAGLAVFMRRTVFNETFDMEVQYLELARSHPLEFVKQILSPIKTEYFTGYFSEKEIKDIDKELIESCITEEDLTKLSRQMDVSMGNMFDMVNVFAVIMAALLIYLLTKMILEKNSNAISMVKILGYENGEIARLYLLATTWVVVVSVIAGILFAAAIIKVIYPLFMMEFNGWFSLWFAPEIFPEMFVMMMAAYGIVVFLQFRKIQKIPMDEALKNVE